MKSTSPNFTIIANWKAKGFGCAKVCSYCNWRDLALLPHGGQSAEDISAFISQCTKSFITISGGAEPLYRYDQYGDQLLEMIQTVKAHGFKVRVITREVQHISKLRGIVDHFSVSLDADVMGQLPLYQGDWADMDIEYSMVMPPLPTQELALLRPQYAAMRSQLGKRLVLRENLNSIHPVDLTRLSFGHGGIVFVPKALCLSGRYLSTADCTGHDIVQDNEGLARYLMGNPDVYLFGGFVKHLVNPVVHMEYGDIDAIALSDDVLEALSTQFAFTFKETSPNEAYPRYFLGKSTRAGKTIQLILMSSQTDALRFIHSAQYDVDRVGYSDQHFYFDPVVGEGHIRQAINSKQVSLVPGFRDMGLFHTQRPQIEQRHKVKLLRKGFTITE